MLVSGCDLLYNAVLLKREKINHGSATFSLSEYEDLLLWWKGETQKELETFRLLFGEGNMTQLVLTDL
jgi:hypothetical protein